MPVQGSRLPREVSRSDKLSLPGFENLTVGYNKFLRPNFGGKSSFLSRTSIQRTGAEEGPGGLADCLPTCASGGLAVMDERSHNEFSRDLGDRTLSPHPQPKEILLLAREVIEPPDHLSLSAFCPHFRRHYSRNLPWLTRTSPPGLPASHLPLRAALHSSA